MLEMRAAVVASLVIDHSFLEFCYPLILLVLTPPVCFVCVVR